MLVHVFFFEKKIIILYKDYIRCEGPVRTCFDNDDISSVLHVRVPTDMVQSIKNNSLGNMIKMRCSLGYSQTMHTLLLVMDSDVISTVGVVV